MKIKVNKLPMALATAMVMLAFGSVSGTALGQVKIGFLGGFTGPIETLTPAIAGGAETVAANVNDQGGILGGEMEVVSGDTTCVDATAAANAADRLVNSENVVAIVGALCSGSTISAAETVAIPGNTVMISPASTSPALTTMEDNDLVFRTAPSDAYQGEAMAGLLMSKGIKNIAITYINNDYGKGFADSLSGAMTSMGGAVAASEAHEDGKADYRPEIGSLASSGAEWLVVLGYGDGSGQTIVKQAIEGGDFTKFVGGDGMVSQAFVDNVSDPALEGMILTKPGNVSGECVDAYTDVAQAANQDPNAVFGPQAYDAAFLLALAIQANGSSSRDGVSAALRNVSSPPGEVICPGEWSKAMRVLASGEGVNYEGATGSHDFDENGDVSGIFVEVTVKDGKLMDVGEI